MAMPLRNTDVGKLLSVKEHCIITDKGMANALPSSTVTPRPFHFVELWAVTLQLQAGLTPHRSMTKVCPHSAAVQA